MKKILPQDMHLQYRFNRTFMELKFEDKLIVVMNDWLF